VYGFDKKNCRKGGRKSGDSFFWFVFFSLGSQEETPRTKWIGNSLVMEDQRLTADSAPGRRQTTDAGGGSRDRRISALADTTTARHGRRN